MVIDPQNSDAWKTQLTIAINFISSKDAEEECVMDSTRNRKKFTLTVMQMMLLINSLSHFCQVIKEIQNHQWQ